MTKIQYILARQKLLEDAFMALTRTPLDGDNIRYELECGISILKEQATKEGILPRD